MSPNATSSELSLTVVIPVYNERAWLERSVARVVDELRGAGWSHPAVVIVDDGSTDGTGSGIADTTGDVQVQVLRQENAGRLMARRAGLSAAQSDYLLFLDSRVLLRPGSLAFARRQVSEGRHVWNAHVHVNVHGNPFAKFWDATTRVAWSAYFADPRLVSYGLEEFDRYPKGTTCFLAPTAVLREAFEEFKTFFDDPRFSNDDTSIIRDVVSHERIWISPDFACDYESRDSLQKFIRHANARGTVFIDGHLRRGGRFVPLILAFFPASIAGTLTVFVRWWIPPALLTGVGIGAGALGVARKLPPASAISLGALTPPFVVTYGLGMWRGAILAAFARLRSRRAR